MAQKAAKAAAVATATLKTREKGERTWRGVEIEVADLVGVRDQLLQRLHPLRDPLPPELRNGQ